VNRQETVAAHTLRERFDCDPDSVASAPGRVNLVGGHTDYNDGFVLPVAVDRRTAVAARARGDGLVRVHSTRFGSGSFALDDRQGSDASIVDSTAVVELEGEDRDDDGWLDYVAGVWWALREAGHPVGGAALAIDSAVPPGAGLASSAALTVAVAAALDDCFDLGLADREVARVAHRAEREFVGVECGVMDQFAAAFGEPGAALFLDCRSAEVRPVPVPDDCRIVVVDTGVEHRLADSAYNDRRAACRRGVTLLADDGLAVESLRDVSVADLDAHRDALPPTVFERCAHVARENDRVRAAANALAGGDLETVGDLLVASHRSLRDRYEVSCPELDAVVELARETPGVLGARLTGAGFGGAVVGLVRPDAVEAFRATVEREYPRRTGLEPTVYGCEVDGGVRVVSDAPSTGENPDG